MNNKGYSIEEALSAQKALRKAAGLGPEQFPVEAFVGMISDEVEALRKQGKSDDDIARVVRENSKIELTGADIAKNYASHGQRHPEEK